MTSTTSTTSQPSDAALLVLGAHAGDFVRRPGGTIALAAARMALQARVPAQAVGYDAPGEPLATPPVFFFEPHQPEQCDFEPNLLLDITAVFDTDLAKLRGVQLKRNAGPSLGLSQGTMGGAYVRLYPETTGVPA